MFFSCGLDFAWDYCILVQAGPRSRIRGDPLPHSHNTLAATPCFLQAGQVREQEVHHNTEHLPLFSRADLVLPEEEEEIIRLPWRGQCGRAAAARALCACCAAGYAKDCTGSPVCF
jgi:hypothetical protein